MLSTTLHRLLRNSAVRNPDGIAVVDAGRSITYRELDDRSDRLAGLLHEVGVRKGDRVGLYLNKSLEAVVGIYGILKSGAAYVPLDPQAPPARLGGIAANCGLRILLSGTEKAERWQPLVDGGARLETLIVINGEPVPGPPGVRMIGAESIDQWPRVLADDTISLDLAYILYTSGSTGEPKGVKLTHANALAFVDWAVDHYEIGPDDKLSSHAPFHFDLSVFDLYAAAEAGASVVLVPTSIAAFPVDVATFIRSEGITVWYSVPSILSMMTLRGELEEGDLQSLRLILFAGEVFPTKYLRRLMSMLPHVRFSNLYGPTETNVCTFLDVPQLPADMVVPISIGRAIDGVEVVAVTDGGRRAQRGEVGELYVRGPTVMQGYWGDEERTARTLIRNPFEQELRDPMYRTGDLVVEQEDGTFTFLGRRDNQIKSRGYRIELGDIESALYAHPDVTECAVTAVPDDLVTNRLKAYVVVRNFVREADLMRFLASRLPKYMIPESFEFADALPKTSTGKIDKRSLASATR
jgi:amino acid adenylation domain-containing protein